MNYFLHRPPPLDNSVSDVVIHSLPFCDGIIYVQNHIVYSLQWKMSFLNVFMKTENNQTSRHPYIYIFLSFKLCEVSTLCIFDVNM